MYLSNEAFGKGKIHKIVTKYWIFRLEFNLALILETPELHWGLVSRDILNLHK